VKKSIGFAFLLAVLAASCSPAETAVPPTETAAPPTQTPPPSATATVTQTPTNATLPAVERSAVSGLPYPAGAGAPGPGGEPGALTVLDWAGFAAAVSYTFDDGQPSQIEHYAELAAQGVPMTFYICAGWSGTSGNFTEAWSRAAADGNEIGNHTVNHPHASLTDTATGKGPLATHELEISEDAAYITDTLSHRPVWSFAAPYGDRGWAPYAAEFYFVNRGVGYGTIAPLDGTDPLNLPVFAAVGGESAKALDGELDLARRSGRWLIFLFHSLLPTSRNWYAGVETENVTASMYHARAAGDVWADALYKVAAYWIGQKILARVEPERSGGTFVWRWSLPAHFPTGTYLRVRVGGGKVFQKGVEVPWDPHGFYEVALDAGELTVAP
jgi:peptidoglycan/xylan/chitin deacetylase (PgdA/CDA1 family)